MLKVFNEGDGVFSTSDGAKLSYRRTGTSSMGIMFLHGWGGSASYWDEMLRHMSTDVASLIRMDLRGHGRSEPTLAGFTTERFGNDVLELSRHLQLEKLILVGYSMSARWAQWVCCSETERVAGQILIAPVPTLALTFPEGMVENWIEQVRTREGFHAFERQFMTRQIDADLLDDCYDAIATTPPHSLRETLRMCTDAGFVERLASTRVPTLIISGEHDAMFTADLLRAEIVERIPGAEMVVLPCGHNLPLEMPGELARIVNGFVAALPTQSRVQPAAHT